MPLYEYQCEVCDTRFEVIRKFSDPPVDTCKVCGKGPVRRLQSSPAIQFKGSGFYITDYAKKSGSDAPSSGATETSADTKGADTKGADTKGADAKAADAKGASESKSEGGTKKTETASKSDGSTASSTSTPTTSKD